MTKTRVTLRSARYGEFDLDELVDRLCHSHAPHPREEDLYNAQVAILKLADMMRASDEPSGDEAIIALADATERARGTRNIDPCLMELWDAVIKRRAQRRGG